MEILLIKKIETKIMSESKQWAGCEATALYCQIIIVDL